MLVLRRVFNKNYEEEIMLENVDTGEVLLMGDYYHDKIDNQIEGFLKGLKYAGKRYMLLSSVIDTRPEFYG